MGDRDLALELPAVEETESLTIQYRGEGELWRRELPTGGVSVGAQFLSLAPLGQEG